MKRSIETKDYLRLFFDWEDTTPYGVSVSGRLQDFVRRELYPRTTRRLLRLKARPQAVSVDRLVEDVLKDRASPEYQAVVADPRFWAPPADLVRLGRFRALSMLDQSALSLDLRDSSYQEVREAFLEGKGPLAEPFIRAFSTHRSAASRVGIKRPRSPSGARITDPCFVGHACLSWGDGHLRLWTDPFFRPKNLRYPATYQPLNPLDFPESEHVVLLTHSHPDHFDPASLIFFPAKTLFLVPRLAGPENILSLNLKSRLRDLGFSNVREMAWWQRKSVGGFEVCALPFYGEQPLGPFAGELQFRNQGNAWHIRNSQGRSLVALADSGADSLGHAIEVAQRVRRDFGPVDHLFTNHRRWRYFPPQILLSSVPEFLTLIDSQHLGVEQQIMLTPEQVGVIGDILHCRTVTPYAMGGAPWFSEIGLGTDPFERNDGRDSFDAHPSDILKIRQVQDPQNVRLEDCWRPVLLWPSEFLGSEGRIREWPGFERPSSSDFQKIPKNLRATTPNYFVARNFHLEGADASGLLAMLSVFRNPHVVAAPGFLEVGFDVGAPGKQRRGAMNEEERRWSTYQLRAFFARRGGSWEEGHVSQSAGLLAMAPEALNGFLEFQRRSYACLLSKQGGRSDEGGCDGLGAKIGLGRILDAQSVRRVAEDYLRLDLGDWPPHRARVRSPVSSLRYLPRSAYQSLLPHLPVSPALPLEKRKSLADAWIDLKTLHVAYLTLRTLGRTELSECEWLNRVFLGQESN